MTLVKDKKKATKKFDDVLTNATPEQMHDAVQAAKEAVEQSQPHYFRALMMAIFGLASITTSVVAAAALWSKFGDQRSAFTLYLYGCVFITLLPSIFATGKYILMGLIAEHKR